MEAGAIKTSDPIPDLISQMQAQDQTAAANQKHPRCRGNRAGAAARPGLAAGFHGASCAGGRCAGDGGGHFGLDPAAWNFVVIFNAK
jgi:hypothetical protein